MLYALPLYYKCNWNTSKFYYIPRQEPALISHFQELGLRASLFTTIGSAYPLRCTTAHQWFRFASSAHQFPEVWRRVWQVNTDVNTTCEVHQGLRRSSRIHVRVGTTYPDTNGCGITNTDIWQMSLWENTFNNWETIHCFSILGIGFLQQSRPELSWVFGVNKDQSPIDCW